MTPAPTAPARPWPRAVLSLSLAIVTVLSVLAAREVAIGRQAARAADAAAGRSDWPEAIAQARAAAEAIAPASPWPGQGMRRLAAIGHDAEARGDDPVALLAYGAMRTAALETRALTTPATPSSLWRRAAEEGLGRVAASSKETPRPRPAAVLEALQSDDAPSTWKLAVLSATALVTIGALAALCFVTGPSRLERAARGAAAAGFLVYATLLLLG